MMKGNQNPKDDGCFLCLKVTLMVLYIMALIIYVILGGLTVVGLGIFSHAKTEMDKDSSLHIGNSQGGASQFGHTQDDSSTKLITNNQDNHFGSSNFTITWGEGKATTKEVVEQLRKWLIIYLISLSISTMVTIMGLVGAIKEHRIIMIIMTVIGVVEIGLYLFQKYWFSVILEVILTVITGWYAYLLQQRYNEPGEISNFAL